MHGLIDDTDRNRAETQNQWFFIGIIGKKRALSVVFFDPVLLTVRKKKAKINAFKHE